MPTDGLPTDTEIIAAAYSQRIGELFKVFAESVYTGEPEAAATTRFRRGLLSARRVYAAALAVAQEVEGERGA